MSIEQKGGYLYILENEGTGELKFGRTMKNIYSSYASSTRYNPKNLRVRANHFFENARKEDLKLLEDRIKADSIVNYKKVRGSNSEWLEGILFEYLDDVIHKEYVEWRSNQGGLQKLIRYNSDEESIRNILKIALANKAKSQIYPPRKITYLYSTESQNDKHAADWKAVKNSAEMQNKKKIRDLLIQSISINNSRKSRRGSSPVQMSSICKKLRIDSNTTNYKIISYWFKTNSITPRFTNGKKVFDIAFAS